MPMTSDPPGPKPAVPVRNLLLFRRDPIRFLRRVAADYGDICAFRIAAEPLFLLSHPDLIRDVLVTNARSFHKGRGLERAKRLLGEGLLTSEGDFHRRQRRLMQPAFHRERLAAFGEIMVGQARQAAESWRDGESRDIAADMMRLTVTIVARTLFNADVAGEAARIGAAVSEAIRLFQLLMLPFAEWLERLPLPATRRFRAVRKELDTLIYGLIAAHRESGRDQGDLLSMLLAATDEDDHSMSDEQIRDEALTIFLAGHETVANALAWTWYLLAKHPGVEERLQAEIQSVLVGRPPAIEDVPRLTYVRRVLAESMRLFPPAWIIGRRAIADCPVGGYIIPKGSIVLLSQAVTHHDARWFPDPDRFDPDRWLPEAESARPRFSYFPFGGGPRICIGESFAWMEGVLVLATLAQMWRLHLAPGQKIAWQPIITLRPRYGIRMIPERRSGA